MSVFIRSLFLLLMPSFLFASYTVHFPNVHIKFSGHPDKSFYDDLTFNFDLDGSISYSSDAYGSYSVKILSSDLYSTDHFSPSSGGSIKLFGLGGYNNFSLHDADGVSVRTSYSGPVYLDLSLSFNYPLDLGSGNPRSRVYIGDLDGNGNFSPPSSNYFYRDTYDISNADDVASTFLFRVYSQGTELHLGDYTCTLEPLTAATAYIEYDVPVSISVLLNGVILNEFDVSSSVSVAENLTALNSVEFDVSDADNLVYVASYQYSNGTLDNHSLTASTSNFSETASSTVPPDSTVYAYSEYDAPHSLLISSPSDSFSVVASQVYRAVPARNFVRIYSQSDFDKLPDDVVPDPDAPDPINPYPNPPDPTPNPNPTPNPTPTPNPNPDPTPGPADYSSLLQAIDRVREQSVRNADSVNANASQNNEDLMNYLKTLSDKQLAENYKLSNSQILAIRQGSSEISDKIEKTGDSIFSKLKDLALGIYEAALGEAVEATTQDRDSIKADAQQKADEIFGEISMSAYEYEMATDEWPILIFPGNPPREMRTNPYFHFPQLLQYRSTVKNYLIVFAQIPIILYLFNFIRLREVSISQSEFSFVDLVPKVGIVATILSRTFIMSMLSAGTVLLLGYMSWQSPEGGTSLIAMAQGTLRGSFSFGLVFDFIADFVPLVFYLSSGLFLVFFRFSYAKLQMVYDWVVTYVHSF